MLSYKFASYGSHISRLKQQIVYLCTERRTNAADANGDEEDFEEDGDGDGEGVVPDDGVIVDLLYGCVVG